MQPLKDIRTSKDGNWAWFNKQIFEDPRLRPIEKLVYLGLTYFVNNETQACFPSIAKLKEITGLGRRSIIKALHRLEELGYIHIERNSGGSSTYYLLNTNQNVKDDPVEPVHDMHQCTGCTSAQDAPVHQVHRGGAPHAQGGAPGAQGWCTTCTYNNNYLTRFNNNTYLTKNKRSNFEKLNFEDKNFLEKTSLKENLDAPIINNAPTNNNCHLENDFAMNGNDPLVEGGATLCKIGMGLEPVSNILNLLLSPKEKNLLEKAEKYKVENIEERLKMLNEQAEKLCKIGNNGI